MTEVVLVTLLGSHLLAMNLASAGPLVSLALRGGPADQIGRRLAWLSIAALVAGVGFGTVTLLLPSTGPLWDAFGRFPMRAYSHAGLELVFSLLCMVFVATMWRRVGKRSCVLAIVAFVTATNLLYHFPPLMVILGKLAAQPSWTSTPEIDRPALRELMLRGDVLALSIHFALASFAVAGVVALVLIARQGDSVWSDPAVRKPARISAGIALVATLLQLPAGLWLLSTMSYASRGALMGTSLVGSIAFLIAIVLTMLLAGRLLGVLLGDVSHRDACRAGWVLVVVVLLMTGALRSTRVPADANSPTGVSSLATALHPL